VGSDASRTSPQNLRANDLRGLLGDDVETGEIGRLERAARVVSRGRVLDGDRARLVVAYEEDRAAALVGDVVFNQAAGDIEDNFVAIIVDRAAVAALSAVGAVTDGGAFGEQAVENVPRDACC
jgi:hypothetical protein